MTLVLTANVVLAVIVLTAIIGLLAWPILTSRRSQQTPAAIKSIGIRGPYARRYGRRPRTTTR